MAFARMARWADDLTLLLAPGVKLFMRKSQNLEVHEVTYRLFLEHGRGLYMRRRLNDNNSAGSSPTRAAACCPTTEQSNPAKCQGKLRLLGRRLADAMLSSTQLLSLPLTFLLFITLLQHHV